MTTDAPEALPPPIVDAALLAKYPSTGPRYTSYPTADRFHERFGPAAALRQLKRRGESTSSEPLSLYVHLPFCDTLCLYCACNKVVTRDRARASRYLDYVEREILTQRGAIGRDEAVSQLHWGGGTPTFLPVAEMSRLMESLRGFFNFRPDGEYSIEIDPRRLEPGTIDALAALGFNRLSIGVQDFDAAVQRKVNRIQSVDETARAMMAARAAGFRSVNLDLIYGLPGQSAATFGPTLDAVLDLQPDRIALYAYAHLPEVYPSQQRIDAAELPTPEERIGLLTLAIERLTAGGYLYIGMDHFALPGDDLALAQARGALQRNFQGYSTHARTDLLAFGVSAISSVGGTYGQNHRDLDHYYASLDRGELPVFRGHELDPDDLIRREVIQQIACNFRLRFDELEARLGIRFATYFAAEDARLAQLEADGLLVREPGGLAVTPRGRLLVRVVCMAFDRHLAEARAPARYSRVV